MVNLANISPTYRQHIANMANVGKHMTYMYHICQNSYAQHQII